MEKIENLIAEEQVKTTYNMFDSKESNYFNNLDNTDKCLYLIQKKFMTDNISHDKSVMTVREGFTESVINSTDILQFLLRNCNMSPSFRDLISDMSTNYYSNYVSVVIKVIGSVIRLNIFKESREKKIRMDLPTLELICNKFNYCYFSVIKHVMIMSNRTEYKNDANEYLCKVIQEVHGVSSEFSNHEYLNLLNLLSKGRKRSTATAEATTTTVKKVTVMDNQIKVTPTDFGFSIPISVNWNYSVAI